MNLLNDIGNLISKTAPTIATALGGPIAGTVVTLLENAFGVPKEQLMDTISITPDAVLKLKTLEMQHCEELARINSTNYQTEVDDRKSARQREISLHDFVPSALAIGFLLNYAAIQFYCVTHNNTINDIISARFQDVLIMIISYYFGSTHKQLTTTKMQ